MKPFGQPVTEILDFEEGSRFAALTVKAVQNELKNIRKMRQFFICINNCFTTVQNRVNFADFVSNSKQSKLLNQNFFQNIF